MSLMVAVAVTTRDDYGTAVLRSVTVSGVPVPVFSDRGLTSPVMLPLQVQASQPVTVWFGPVGAWTAVVTDVFGAVLSSVSGSASVATPLVVSVSDIDPSATAAVAPVLAADPAFSATYAPLADRYRTPSFPGWPIASKALTPDGQEATTGNTSRWSFVATQNAADVCLTYINTVPTTSGESDAASAITVKASIELPSGTIIPLTFNGAVSAVIDPGGRVTTDPLGIEVTAGARYWVRTYATCASNLPRTTITFGGSPLNEGVAAGDLTAAGAGAVATSTTFAFVPSVVSGVVASTTAKFCAVVGDSRVRGAGDSGVDQDRGYVTMAHATAGVGAVKTVRSGSTAQGWAAVNGHYRRAPLIAGIPNVEWALGINDITNGRSLANIQTDAITGWLSLARRGARRIIAHTVMPNSSSTDSWATVGNQTVANAGQNTIRINLNNWLRDGAPLNGATFAAVPTGDSSGTTVRAGQVGHPLYKVREVADTVESSRDSGLWKAAHTGDGLHPNTTGHTAASAVIDVADYVA